MSTILMYPIIGFLVGTIGTLIGAGGGFLLVPLLLLLYPEKTASNITSLSLALVFFNALSGSVAYHRLKRIDYKSGIIFALCTIPGAILGSLITTSIDRQLFDRIFGILMMAIAFYLTTKPKLKSAKTSDRLTTRHLTDSTGVVYEYRFNLLVGAIFSAFIGFLSSLLGIGGGIIHVPVLVQILGFPVHIATATSQFVLAIMSLAGSTVHLFSSALTDQLLDVVLLSGGAIIGAQVGARLSKRIQGGAILKLLAIALAIVGVRIFWGSF